MWMMACHPNAAFDFYIFNTNIARCLCCGLIWRAGFKPMYSHTCTHIAEKCLSSMRRRFIRPKWKLQQIYNNKIQKQQQQKPLIAIAESYTNYNNKMNKHQQQQQYRFVKQRQVEEFVRANETTIKRANVNRTVRYGRLNSLCVKWVLFVVFVCCKTVRCCGCKCMRSVEAPGWFD